MKSTVKSTRPKTATITLNDLSQALKQPWNTRTCLLAQTAKRLHIFEYDAVPDPYIIRDCSNRAREAMNLFDQAVAHKPERDARKLRELRSMLPIKVRLSLNGGTRIAASY